MSFAQISSRLVLCLLTLLFWAASAGLSYIAAMFFMTYERTGSLLTYIQSLIPALIMLGIALIMLIIGIIGVCGLFTQNRCMLAMFFTLLTTLLSLEIAGIVILGIFQGSVNVTLRQTFDGWFNDYGNTNYSIVTQNIDYLQTTFKCCGEQNYTDWKRSWWYTHTENRYGEIPQSCCVAYTLANETNVRFLNEAVTTFKPDPIYYCRGASPLPIPTDNYYVHGCYSMLLNTINSRYWTLVCIILGLMIVQLVGVVSTCVLLIHRAKGGRNLPYMNIATHEDAHYNL